eukprot:UN08397
MKKEIKKAEKEFAGKVQKFEVQEKAVKEEGFEIKKFMEESRAELRRAISDAQSDPT